MLNLDSVCAELERILRMLHKYSRPASFNLINSTRVLTSTLVWAQPSCIFLARHASCFLYYRRRYRRNRPVRASVARFAGIEMPVGGARVISPIVRYEHEHIGDGILEIPLG